MSVVVGGALLVAVAAAWLAALALLRLPRALDRLHAVSFLNAVSAAGLTVAAIATDGFSTRALKVLLLSGLLVGFGALLSHVSGRALLLREGRGA